MLDVQTFDIIIIGAGPAGATATMCLQDIPLRVAVVDKACFPRDKICGDAIPSRAVKVLREVAPDLLEELIQTGDGQVINSCQAHSPAGHTVAMSFSTLGFNATREVFDHYLLRGAQRNPYAQFFLGHTVEQINIDDAGVNVTLNGGRLVLQGAIIIGCDGANSVVARSLTQRKVIPKHHCGAVRAYYKNVTGLESNQTVFYLLKNYLPGYFWIFPLPDGWYNVGFGMLSKDITRKGVNLRDSLRDIIAAEPTIRTHFAEAALMGEITGFGLPLGSLQRRIAGFRFMLAGDAAGLIDPATGEGIGSAMLSAQLAAGYAKAYFADKQPDAIHFADYQRAVYQKLGAELKLKYYLQQLVSPFPGLIDQLVRLGANHPGLVKIANKFL